MSALSAGFVTARQDEIAAGLRCRVCELLIFDGPDAAAAAGVNFYPAINRAHGGLCVGCGGGDSEMFMWSTAVALVEGDGVKKTGVTTMTDLRVLYPDEVVDAFEVQQAEIDADRRKNFYWSKIINDDVVAVWQQWRAEGATYQEIKERSGMGMDVWTVRKYMQADDDEPEPEPAVRAQTPPQRTAAELENLQAQWEADPCWDIEETEGFEAHYDELFDYRKQKSAEWERARQETAVSPTPAANGTHETAVSRIDGVGGVARLELEIELQ